MEILIKELERIAYGKCVDSKEEAIKTLLSTGKSPSPVNGYITISRADKGITFDLAPKDIFLEKYIAVK